MVKILKSKNTLLLLLPLMLGFAFQATQYARAPAEYNYYLVYAKNADIALKPGNDLSPNGQTLLQNSTSQQGYYTLTLGNWAPGYNVNYTDAIRVYNREVFDIRMIGLNFTTGATGSNYLRIMIQNDTNADGVGDTWVTVWDGTTVTLSTSNYIYLKKTSTYETDGGYAKIQIDVAVGTSGIGLSNGQPELAYTGNLNLWFSSAAF